MTYLTTDQEKTFKKNLGIFVRKFFKAKVKTNVKLFENYNFAPTFHLKKKNREERIILFRNPATYPVNHANEIKIASQRGIGVYIAICDGEPVQFINELSEICEKQGLGIIQHRGKSNFSILPCVQDYPKDKLIAGRLSFFVSSRLGLDERLMIRQKLIELRHQPVLVERISKHAPMKNEYLSRIEKSDFFIGLITAPLRPAVNLEIRHAIKKKKNRFKIYIRTDAFDSAQERKTKKEKSEKQKLSELIRLVEKTGSYSSYGGVHDLKKQIKDDVTALIKDNLDSK